MDELKELIVTIQIIAGVAALYRMAAILLETVHDEDKSPRNKKLKNLMIAIILIETITTAGNLILHYYR